MISIQCDQFFYDLQEDLVLSPLARLSWLCRRWSEFWQEIDINVSANWGNTVFSLEFQFFVKTPPIDTYSEVLSLQGSKNVYFMRECSCHWCILEAGWTQEEDCWTSHVSQFLKLEIWVPFLTSLCPPPPLTNPTSFVYLFFLAYLSGVEISLRSTFNWSGVQLWYLPL